MITPRDLVCHELIGLPIAVARSTDDSKIGLTGTVVDESRNMLIIETTDGRRSVAKDECAFHFTLPQGERVEVEGTVLVARPEDRIKKLGKKMGCDHGRM